ncbi:alpha/beta fold hydrolase [Nocardia puris]|uniref:Pimeloyl-ACP methyl ester carboxylesterase n=1 Tax=Nocardia puris TaxID=208602 RepID=A0A366CZC6_9NOCA|nr:alpha/beta hydrolase [Nocardia puris]RBO83015.1 pimeloyl-ACP methyl ester carboxylesterase [Nocardia puris]
MIKPALAAVAALALSTTALLTGCTDSAGESPAAQPGRHAQVNGLDMYYEVHGEESDQPPLVLLHGALSGIGTDFGDVLPGLSENRQIIAIEQQAHGRTADIDRPLRTEHMADDTAALLRQIGIEQADLFGYSMGAGVALDIGLRHPGLVRKLVLLSVGLSPKGLHPGVLDGITQLEPEMLHGSPFHTDYLANAPRPQDFPTLVAKVKEMDANTPTFPADAVAAMPSPTLTIVADSDIVTPEHAVEIFRLRGGGIMGDTPAGLPDSELAILPGASHISGVHRPELLVPMITTFLDRTAKS